MKKILPLILLAVLFNRATAQQQVLLYVDTFSAANASDVIFDAAGVGGNFGNNDWVVNADYNGQPTYPNTISEDSVFGGLGQITGAPHSRYLHIHDSVEPGGVANANWNPMQGSDRFCYLSSAFCTSGLTDVKFTFFWTGGGDSTAYGQVYYSTDYVNWVQTGRAKYNNQHYWTYEAISDTNFNNQPNLIFGFRWVNSANDTTHDASLGIADIIAEGTYLASDTGFHIISVTPDTNCGNSAVTVTFTLNPPLCFASYIAYLSNGSGSFVQTTILNPNFYLNQSNTIWQTQVYLPGNETGNCFRLFLARESSAPFLHSDTSACFTIMQCPFSIVTNNAPVMVDADTACVKSAIDVYFNSFGTVNPNNVYTAVLSDSTGSFIGNDTLGSFASGAQFPSLPGSVPGIIPANTPPGCGYYIRVISSSPHYVGNAIGPFCIKHCDVTTNNTADIHVCINYPYPTDTVPLVIADNQWGQGATYDTCNNWRVELLDMQTFSVVDTGFKVYHTNASGTFALAVGPLDSLPVPPGEYYMRITSSCSSEPWNETGTVIRIAIGAPTTGPSVGIYGAQGDSVYCYTTEILLCATPYNNGSNYFWTSNLLASGSYEIAAPCLGIVANGNNLGNWVFYLQEENFGCFGPHSAPYNIVITALPQVTLTGPTKVCLGDTAVLNATYYPATYYNWTAPAGVNVDLQSNTQVSMVFDSLGVFDIETNAVNVCGSSRGTEAVNVINLFSSDTMSNKTVCNGDTVTLTRVVQPYPQTFISLDSSTFSTQGGMFNIHAINDVVIDSFAVSFRSPIANSKISIYSKPGTYHGFEQSVSSWDTLTLNTNIAVPGPNFTKTVIPVELNKTIATGDTVAFYIMTANASNLAYDHGSGLQQGAVYKSDGIIDFVQGSINANLFGTSSGPDVLDVTIYYRTLAGLHYLWNNGDTTNTISFVPTQNSQYTIDVFNGTGCRSVDSVKVFVDTLCTSGFKNAAGNPTIQIYPNPTSGTVNLVIDGAGNAVKTLQVVNSLGQQIDEQQYNPGDHLATDYDLGSLPSGIYYFKVTVGENVQVFEIALIR